MRGVEVDGEARGLSEWLTHCGTTQHPQHPQHPQHLNTLSPPTRLTPPAAAVTLHRSHISLSLSPSLSLVPWASGDLQTDVYAAF